VISHRPYNGPWFIGEVVKGDSDIGASYRLINVKTGKPYKFLVLADRLKAYTADKRLDLVRRLLTDDQKKEGSSENQQTAADADEDSRVKDAVTSNKSDIPDSEPAVKVLKQRKNGNIVTQVPGRTEVTGREVNKSRHRFSSTVSSVYSTHTIMHFDTTKTQRSFVLSTTTSLLYRVPLHSLLEAANQPDTAPAGSLL